MQTRVSILPAIKRAISSKPGFIKLFAIAALLSMAVALFISVRKESFYFEVKLRSSQAGAAQLYYNLGRGMNERDSAQVPVRAGDSMTTVRFPLPAGEYNAFRFDPIDRGYCNIAIGHAQIVGEDKLVEFLTEEIGVESAKVDSAISELKKNGQARVRDVVLSDADLLVRPAPSANHIAWQLGHLVLAEPFLIRTELPDAAYPELPAGFADVCERRDGFGTAS